MIESFDDSEKSKNKTNDAKSKTPVLDNFSRDLIKSAEEGKLDPVIGREGEINRIAQILSILDLWIKNFGQKNAFRFKLLGLNQIYLSYFVKTQNSE